MRLKPGQWDCTLYDTAFRSAGKHHVRIVATVTPNGPPLFRGGNGSQGREIIDPSECAAVAAVYIKKTVEGYRSSSALDTWLPVNEPGQRSAASPPAAAALRTWAARNFGTVAAMNQAIAA